MIFCWFGKKQRIDAKTLDALRGRDEQVGGLFKFYNELAALPYVNNVPHTDTHTNRQLLEKDRQQSKLTTNELTMSTSFYPSFRY